MCKDNEIVPSLPKTVGQWIRLCSFDFVQEQKEELMLANRFVTLEKVNVVLLKTSDQTAAKERRNNGIRGR